ncbi:GNAT family N-acetyltransferase [Streptosporangium sp. NPDC051023]|uniref:GNAT family N-acetyltransferase n=1 Tax=Streptosporangium sp. NPDC051023 TaxID=3155410 RepID=UPI00344C4887
MELTAAEDVTAACHDDTLVVWAAQGMPGGVRAWALGEAVAVASPELNRRDRLTVLGPAAQVAALVLRVLPELGPSYRLLGDRALIAELAERMPGTGPVRPFEWMDTARPSSPQETAEGTAEEIGWLGDADGEVAALLAEAAPSAWAVPGLPGIRRWAGVRSSDGTLVATAADAWSCPAVGFVAGVATAQALRGRGYGRRVCAFAFDALIAAHGRVALVVDTDNYPAIGVYERLGLNGRPVAALALPAAP